MGTASTTKVLKHDGAGAFSEETTLTTSAGAGDANKIPALGAAGKLDISITNGTVTSAGSGDAGKLVALGGDGKIDVTAMPAGIGADTKVIVASEALAAGDFVNVWNSTGAKVRKADASTAGKQADGYVKAAVSNGGNATVYFEGPNTGLSGLTPGKVFLSTTPGLSTATAPTGSGNIVQKLGTAVAADEINVEFSDPITLA